MGQRQLIPTNQAHGRASRPAGRGHWDSRAAASVNSACSAANGAAYAPRFDHTAVARNRLRRRVREILRRDLLSRLPSVDLVVRAKRAAYSARFAVLRDELAEASGHVSP